MILRSLLIVAGILGLLVSATAAADNPRPNIVFLFADDQNTASIGIYGNPEVQTPHMDQLLSLIHI